MLGRACNGGNFSGKTGKKKIGWGSAQRAGDFVEMLGCSYKAITDHLGIYCYLKIVSNMTVQADQTAKIDSRVSAIAMSVIWILIIAMIYLAVYPQIFIEYLASIAL